MAKIKLTLPGLEIPVDGKQVSFTAPCSCSAVDGIQIDGVDYDLVDSAGNVVPFGRFVWCEGAVLTVTLDVTNRKAYLQNQNAYTRYEALTPATAELFGLGADAVPDDVFGVLKTLIDGNATAIANGAKIATGSYTGTGTYGKNNPTKLTFDFIPKFVIVITQYSVQPESYNGFVWAGQPGTASQVQFSVSGNTLSWHTTATSQGAMIQRNDSGSVYHYIAIG